MSPNRDGSVDDGRRPFRKEIYTIPPSSPVYNVTYVTQSTTPEGTIQRELHCGISRNVHRWRGRWARFLPAEPDITIPHTIGYPVGGYPIYHPYAMHLWRRFVL